MHLQIFSAAYSSEFRKETLLTTILRFIQTDMDCDEEDEHLLRSMVQYVKPDVTVALITCTEPDGCEALSRANKPNQIQRCTEQLTKSQ